MILEARQPGKKSEYDGNSSAMRHAFRGVGSLRML
jgi:hypothetical protein